MMRRRSLVLLLPVVALLGGLIVSLGRGGETRQLAMRASHLVGFGSQRIAFASERRSNVRATTIAGSIRLRHHDVRSGRTVRGELVFENNTSETRVLLRGCKIDGVYGIGFRASDGYTQDPAFSLVGCHPQQEMVARPGTTVYRFKVAASYIQCSQSAKHQPPKGSKYWIPVCLKDSHGERDIMPPLPPGRYRALFFPDGEWHGPRVKPADLVITKAK